MWHRRPHKLRLSLRLKPLLQMGRFQTAKRVVQLMALRGVPRSRTVESWCVAAAIPLRSLPVNLDLSWCYLKLRFRSYRFDEPAVVINPRNVPRIE